MNIMRSMTKATTASITRSATKAMPSMVIMRSTSSPGMCRGPRKTYEYGLCHAVLGYRLDNYDDGGAGDGPGSSRPPWETVDDRATYHTSRKRERAMAA